MSFFTRLENGWKITINSFKILKANQQLIAFPILSGVSIILIMASFFTAVFAAYGWHLPHIKSANPIGQYALLLAFYVVNYFVVVFFNMALVHCTHLYFKGEEVTVGKGLRFSLSRIGVIFTWSVFAGTIGFILKLIQERSGIIGKIITGIIGIIWSIATFFVIPIIAYENLGPVDAVKRSTELMKQKWGESLASRFSFGLIQLGAMIVIAIPLILLGVYVNLFIAIVIGVLALFILAAVMSAAQTIFVSAVYHNVTDEPVAYFDQQLIDNLFQPK